MLRDVLHVVVPMKSYFEPVSSQFLSQLLERDPEKRLGGFKEGEDDDASDIRAHPYFASVDWYQVKYRNHKTLFVPNVKSPEDTSKIDSDFTNMPLQETFVHPQ